MKLVTGIEAIQSGKPFKICNDGKVSSWINPSAELGDFTPSDLLKKDFIIKEEPREFWIFNPSSGDLFVYSGDYKGADFSGDNWIRVREIEK